MSPVIPGHCQLVLDFDGVLCDSAAECLQICWWALQDAPAAAFQEPVPAEVAARYWRTRPFMRHLGHFIVPLLDGPAPADRAAFAERFARLPDGLADSFARKARAYRATVSAEHREPWLALHGVWEQVARLVDGAYLATARDRASVAEILGAHGVCADPARIFDELTEKTATLDEVARRESLPREDVWLLDDSIDNCLAARAAGFGTVWASWGCGDPGDRAIAEDHGIPVLELADIPDPEPTTS